MTKEFTKLPLEIKKLVQTGMYSLYRLNSPAEGNNPFMLVTNARDFFLLNLEGNTPKKISSQVALSYELGESIKFNIESSSRTVSLLSDSYTYSY